MQKAALYFDEIDEQPVKRSFRGYTPAILATVLCFFPIGIFSLIFASLEKKSIAYGRWDDALYYAKKGQIYVKAAILFGFVMWLLVISCLFALIGLDD